jgi:hypothetical protein
MAVTRPHAGLVVGAAALLVSTGSLLSCQFGSASSPSASGTPRIAPSSFSFTNSPSIPLEIRNGSTITVTVRINGQTVAAVQPSDYSAVPAADLPAPPWSVDVLGRNSRSLGSFTVPSFDSVSIESGYGVRLDLNCGRVDVWIGPPLLGPTFVPGESGNC